MPMIMSVMMAWFPAGLVLYWLTNTLLSIAQQWRINRVVEIEARSERSSERTVGARGRDARPRTRSQHRHAARARRHRRGARLRSARRDDRARDSRRAARPRRAVLRTLPRRRRRTDRQRPRAVIFPAPASFTGEDVLELHGHGGPVVMDMLLARC